MAKKKKSKQETRSEEELVALARELIGQATIELVPTFRWDHRGKLKECPAATQLLGETKELQREGLRAAWAFLGGDLPERWAKTLAHLYTDPRPDDSATWARLAMVKELIGRLFRKKVPLVQSDYEEFLRTTAKVLQTLPASGSLLPWNALLKSLEQHVANEGLAPALRAALEPLPALIYGDAEGQRLKDRISILLTEAPSPGVTAASGAAPGELELPPGLARSSAWVEALSAAIDPLPASSRDEWSKLLALCAKAKSSKPSAAWRKKSGALLATQEEASVASLALGACRGALTAPPKLTQTLGFQVSSYDLPEVEQNVLRGLVWCCATLPAALVTSELGDLADLAYKKIPNHGPRSRALGNACVWVLCELGTTEAVGQMVRLQQRVKNRTILKQLARNMERAAERAGVSTAELEELGVPTFGLTEVGRGERELGDHTAVLSLSCEGATLAWRSGAGKTLKSVPAAVKRDHAEALKQLRRQRKDLGAMLAAQRSRLDGLTGSARTWDAKAWRARFLDHPLVGVLARELIWEFEDDERWRAAHWHEDALRDPSGAEVQAHGQVRLWHPARAAPEAIGAWQTRLEALGATQPFQQAHRSVYGPQEGEQTLQQSARFAGTVVRQHQLHALARERGWRMQLFGNFDGGEEPHVELPEWGVRARLGVELEGGWRGETSDAGLYLALTLGTLEFDRPLGEVPPLALSEVLRDVDLFASVAGIGHDPSWAARAGDDSWRAATFGELSEVGRGRKAVLARLVPRLGFAERCSFSDRYLEIRGELRGYKIHLDSAQVLLDPGDAFLPLDPPKKKARSRDALALPFAGDATLSLILAKARLLADDAKIQDETLRERILDA